jgi:ribonucleotide monophosphatase NagD (HAD superfamily)
MPVKLASYNILDAPLLFELDGVLYNAGMLIPGAADTIAWLRARRPP